MTIEEAIQTSLQFENRVVGVYRQAVNDAQDPVGKKVFHSLAEDEVKHVAYLEHKLEEWRTTGRVTPAELGTVVPSREKIEAAVRTLQSKVAAPAPDNEVRLLRQALQVEVETSDFYQRMVRELPPEGRKLFERFVEIEDGHKTIVQAEIDSVSGSGFYFDMPEFNLEAG
jgi:rubrerythrin